MTPQKKTFNVLRCQKRPDFLFRFSHKVVGKLPVRKSPNSIIVVAHKLNKNKLDLVIALNPRQVLKVL